VNGTGY